MPFEDALDTTIHWYEDHEDWWRPMKDGTFQHYYQQQYQQR
jgi:dTDP-glucose 4,6-dehydratase